MRILRKFFPPFPGLFLPVDILRRGYIASEPEKIRSLQSRRLRSLIASAYNKVPFYRFKFEQAGISPSSIRGIEDLPKIPITTKWELKETALSDLISSNTDAGHLIAFKTSGATGIPLEVYQSPYESFLLHLIKLRTLRALGLKWRDRMIKVRSRALTHQPGSWTVLQKTGFLRQEIIDSKAPPIVAAELKGKTADVLTGYSGTLARVAQIFSAAGDKTLRPRLVIGGSDTMTPFLRSQIEKGFGALVRDTYICQETGIVAWECPSSGLYHVVDDSVIVEVLKDGRPCLPGEKGEVFVTNLICRSMPFIRYRLEDSVILSSEHCPCGRQTMSLERILGKLQDYFWLRGGREFNPWELSGMWMGRVSWIMQYELVQETPELIVMRIVPTENPPQNEVKALIRDSRELIGEGVDFRLELVDEIESSGSEKLRVHRSRVRSIYDNPLDPGWLDQ